MSTEAKQKTAEKKKQNKKLLKEFKKKGGGFFADFKAFINKGNVINLAIGIVIGGAFTAIVNSLVGDMIMPIVSILFGKNNLADRVWVVSETLTISWGKFVLAVINFFLIALFLFLLIKIMVNAEKGLGKLKKLHKQSKKTGEEIVVAAVPPPAPIESTEDILKDIRTLLRAINGSGEEAKPMTDETPAGNTVKSK